MLSKTIESIRDQLQAKIEEIDIDEQPERAAQYHVRGVPTLIILDDTGNEVKRKSGAMTGPQLLEFLA